MLVLSNMRIIESRTAQWTNGGRKEQTPPANVFSCQIGIDFMADGQPQKIMLIIINMRIIESRTDRRKEQTPPSKVFSGQIGIDFMMAGWMDNPKTY